MNNHTEEEESLLQELTTLESVVYLLYGREVGEECGTPHLQGYLEVSSRMGIRAVKGLLGNRAHLEIARGSLQSNQTYCRKQGDVFEGGSPQQGQGARSDLLSVKEAIDAGATESVIADNFFGQWVRYSKSFKEYRALKASIPRSWKTKVFILWGNTGTGKTRFVHDQVGTNQELYSPGDYEWFDGYRGQEIVLFDDFRGEYPVQFLLKLLDRYPMQVKIKGSFTEWCPRKVYITSNVNPLDWYTDIDSRTRAALLRRIDNSHHVEVPLYADIVSDRNEFLDDFIQ